MSRLDDKLTINDVAIVVPLSFNNEFTVSERLSLHHLEHYLGNYKKYFIIPRHTKFSYSGFDTVKFPDKYFGNAKNHTFLLGSKIFYEAFKTYKYVLIYHLDSLVFSDQLMKWCEIGYDFIGPPWIKGPDLPWLKKEGVGNGGFALRNVKSFLRYLNSDNYWINPYDYWQVKKSKEPILRLYARIPKKILLHIRKFNNVNKHMKYHIFKQDGNEEPFWGMYKKKYYPEFNIAPVDVALRFGFEANVKNCFERNNEQIPFGCHAWERYDKDFWKPYLLT